MYLGPYQTAHYYNPVTNNIMASIENTSDFDFGCTRLEMIRTGNGASAAWDTTAGSKISNKAYKITAANNNAAAPYNLTLYYTKEEINGWAAATGNNVNELKIVKTSGDILAPVSAPVFSSVNSISNYGATFHKAISATFTGFSSFAITKPFSTRQCPAGNIIFGAGVPGSAYQWQVNTGSGYNNIVNNAFYSGVAADTLRLTSPPTLYYGYRYRCAVSTSFGTVYSPEFTLTFGMTWLGIQSKVWENPLNWGCGSLPDANTDVIINGGANFNPEVNSNATIRSLKVSPAANVMVKTGAVLIIKN
ncbi:MAG: hypothetical protein IPP72_19435 [Chitinophagaceae bacterium]|nr:hypothetical protein [Chitinophagaceae bacterium]